MKNLIRFFTAFNLVLFLKAQDVPETVMRVFEDAKLDPVIAKQKYVSLISKSWPEQSEPLMFFSKNAPEALAIALPRLRSQAEENGIRELFKSPKSSKIILDALLDILQSHSISNSDFSYFSWEMSTGIEFVREAVAKGVEERSHVLLNNINLNDTKQLDQYIEKVRNSQSIGETKSERITKSDSVDEIAQYLQSPNLQDKVMAIAKLENNKEKKANEQLVLSLKSQLSQTKGVFIDVREMFLVIRTINAIEKNNGSSFPGPVPLTRSQLLNFVSNIDVDGKWIQEGVRDSKEADEHLLDKSRRDELAFGIAEKYMKNRDVPYAGREYEIVSEGSFSVNRFKVPKNVLGGDFILKIDTTTGSVVDAKFYR